MNSTNYWKLGAFVLGGLVLAVVALIWLGAADLIARDPPPGHLLRRVGDRASTSARR